MPSRLRDWSDRRAAARVEMKSRPNSDAPMGTSSAATSHCDRGIGGSRRAGAETRDEHGGHAAEDEPSRERVAAATPEVGDPSGAQRSDRREGRARGDQDRGVDHDSGQLVDAQC